MTGYEQIIAIVLATFLATFLAIFLLIAIVAAVMMIKVIKSIKRIAQKAEHLADKAEHIGDLLKTSSKPLTIIRSLSYFADTLLRGSKHGKKKD